jgi:hypothetical protein
VEAGVEFIDADHAARRSRIYERAKKSQIRDGPCRLLLKFLRQ